MSTGYFVVVSILIAMILFIVYGLCSGKADVMWVPLLLFVIFDLVLYVHLGYTRCIMAKKLGISFTETFDGYPCSGCGNVVKLNDKHCISCGAKNKKRYTIVCEGCETMIYDEKYCHVCGRKRTSK